MFLSGNFETGTPYTPHYILLDPQRDHTFMTSIPRRGGGQESLPQLWDIEISKMKNYSNFVDGGGGGPILANFLCTA